MPDHFEKAKDDILARTESNGGPTPHDLLLGMQGLALDVDEAFQEASKDRAQREKRVVALEEWVKTQERECPQRIERMLDERDRKIDASHKVMHGEHLEQDHLTVPEDATATEMRVSYRFVKWLAAGLVIILATVLINFTANRIWQDNNISANKAELEKIIRIIEEEQNEPYHQSPSP